MNVVVDGLMTSYQKIGDGKKTLVFLHGWADSSDTFGFITKHLKAGYSLLLLDLPGMGKTQVPPAAWGISDYSQFVHNWLEKIGQSEVYGFITHSFGGSVAIGGLADSSLSCQRLVLISSAGVRDNNTGKKALLLATAKIAKSGLYVLPKRYRRRLRSGAYRKIGSDLLVLGEMEPTFKKIINEDIQSKARLLKVPTLLIYGTADDQTPVADGKRLQNQIAGSRLEIIEGGDHFMHRTNARVADTIKDFLETK